MFVKRLGKTKILEFLLKTQVKTLIIKTEDTKTKKNVLRYL